MKTRPFFAAGAIFVLSLASAALLFNASPEPKKAATVPSPNPIAIPADLNPSEILTWNCEIPEYKPETILLTCADGGWQVGKISWQIWNKDGAIGTGTFYENLCEPSCAEGKLVQASVNITLSDLTPWRDQYFFRTLDISREKGQDFWWGRAGTLQWDVMEFAEYMNE